MGLSESLKDKLKDFISGKSESSGEVVSAADDLDDFETRDKVVKALRRQKRRQMDIVEKDQLRNSIMAFDRKKASDDFIGKSLFDSSVGGIIRKKKKSVNQGFMGGKDFFSKGGFF